MATARKGKGAAKAQGNTTTAKGSAEHNAKGGADKGAEPRFWGYVVQLQGLPPATPGGPKRQGFYTYAPSAAGKFTLSAEPQAAQRHKQHARGSQWYHWLTGGLAKRGGPVATPAQAALVAVYRTPGGAYTTKGAEPLPPASVVAQCSGCRLPK